MTKKEIEKFFEALGEIWRDFTSVEFLMRCALSKKNGDSDKFPQSPYEEGKIYKEFPVSFKANYFGDVVKDFNREFPFLALPEELVKLRNAMAHGIIASINTNPENQLIKFKKDKTEGLEIEFALELNKKNLEKIRKNIREIRRSIAIEISR